MINVTVLKCAQEFCSTEFRADQTFQRCENNMKNRMLSNCLKMSLDNIEWKYFHAVSCCIVVTFLEKGSERVSILFLLSSLKTELFAHFCLVSKTLVCFKCSFK